MRDVTSLIEYLANKDPGKPFQVDMVTVDMPAVDMDRTMKRLAVFNSIVVAANCGHLTEDEKDIFAPWLAWNESELINQLKEIVNAIRKD